ncbi:aminotransferase class IV [Austwickia chelonae]|uniref:aminotransferase class IV n=1 Tax=Austwickia chelonae TaxID=100225 RepID=UPI000E22B019|nr:aminotransferase class IV [Austwickia chelonae]
MLIVESWRVVDGHIAALDAHRARFLSSCRRHAPDLAVSAFEEAWSEFLLQLPAHGDFFPRLQFDTETKAFRQAVRPSPVRPPTATFWCAPAGDPRRHPEVKGPDLDLLAGLRAQATAAGAQEALILAPDGTVVEGAYTAVVWWEESTLCVRDDSLPRLPSVTEERLLGICARRGIPIRRGRLDSRLLSSHETWIVNSLDQVRLLVSEPGSAGAGLRAESDRPTFSRRFDELSAALWSGWAPLPSC